MDNSISASQIMLPSVSASFYDQSSDKGTMTENGVIFVNKGKPLLTFTKDGNTTLVSCPFLSEEKDKKEKDAVYSIYKKTMRILGAAVVVKYYFDHDPALHSTSIGLQIWTLFFPVMTGYFLGIFVAPVAFTCYLLNMFFK